MAVAVLLASAAPAQELLFLPPPPSTDVTYEVGPAVEEVPSPTPEVPEEVVEEAVEEVVVEEEPAEPICHWYQPAYWFGPTPWDTGIEVGLNGSSGSSDSISTRVGGYLKRKTDTHKLATSLYHNRTKSGGRETQSNALLDTRVDWIMKDSAWTLFIMNQTFYDEFQAFDLNVNINSGFGLDIWDTDFLKFSTSLGAGAARKFGGPRDEWVPEAQAGMNWEQKVSDTQKFSAKLDYFPEWADFNNYRLVSDISWVIQLSQLSNTSLKLSLTDRFDSQSDGVNPHNTNYSVLLLWKK